MKQYKLISEYPGSPKLGTIHWFKIDEFGPSSNNIWQGTNFYDAHPKYWQKVEEVDYEITEVKYATEIRFLDRGFYRIFKDGVGFELDYLLKNGGTIHSVRRKSDDAVFTIGDLVYSKHTFSEYKIDKITVDIGGVSFCSHTSILIFMQDCKKTPKKTPLFTTEDGVEIFEGDYCHYVRKIDCRYEYDLLKKGDRCNGHWISFSTKEKAEEYILLNKPCLSLNDLLSIWGGEYPETSPLFKSFKEIAKSKL